jgi:hypothetical protein
LGAAAFLTLQDCCWQSTYQTTRRP